MRRPAFELLAACIRDDLRPQGLDGHAARLGPRDWEELPVLASHHQIHLLAGTLLTEAGVLPTSTADRFLQEAAARRARRMRGLADLRQLSELLGDRAWALLKGPVLGEHVWSRRGLREYGDLDVLVLPSDVRELLDVLEAAGAELITRNWEYLYTGGFAEVSFNLWRGSTLDLHWNVLGCPYSAPDMRFDTAAVLGRRRPLEVSGGTVAFAPDRADMLLHVAVHGLLDSVATLRTVVDIDQLLRHEAPEPAQLFERMDAQGGGLRLAVALQRSLPARAHAPLDQVMQTAWNRSWWLRLMRFNDRVNTLSRTDGAYPFKVVALSTRDRTGTSLKALARLGVSEVQRRALRRDERESTPWAPVVDDGFKQLVLSPFDDSSRCP